MTLCGFCHIDMEKHPVEQCPYIYKPVFNGQSIVGYQMIDSPLGRSHGTDQPQT